MSARSLHAHRKLTAWLGLLAIWLGVLMPIASQSLQRHHDSELSLTYCVADGDRHVQVPATDTHNTGSHHAAHDWQACGYCGLLAQHMPVPHVAALAIDADAPHRPSAAATYVAVYLRPAHTPAAPRAPPSRLS
ncbi:DUF2946 domain-containing protein [Candidimonas nitroreducens]|uniref:DUF2946 domain-containing protein n=1 Tax=Candidimonas nitroreducens TaxID=683354 RepID=A0A225MYJ9_9BURK|nr:DUF2946 domain-containing protein [Candidimonas nitroreducens]OWT63769.1 hypothetical protein CEY11_05495 [Candidimonas nitroreducens]